MLYLLDSDDVGDSARDKCVGLTQIYVVLEIYYWITNLLHRCFCGLSKCKNRLSIYFLRVSLLFWASAFLYQTTITTLNNENNYLSCFGC